jgi:hypothetical protein
MEQSPLKRIPSFHNTVGTPGCSTVEWPLTPEIRDEGKKTMQTTIAILDKDPHSFKIRPLKQVPTEQRPEASPMLNFDRTRPYVGCRLELPSLYQLAPSRSGSTYSFNSVNSVLSEVGSIQVCMFS